MTIMMLLLLLMMMMMMACGFLPDETECPDRIHTGIQSLEYYVPFGEPFRAWKTLPWRYFIIKPSSLPEAGLGVFTTTFVARNTWLGEYEGEIIPVSMAADDTDFTYTWDSYKNDNLTHYIDGSRPELSNWLRFLNNPNHISHQNVEAHICFGKIFYRTTQDLAPGEELYVFYGDEYAEYLDIDLDCYYDRSRNNKKTRKNVPFCRYIPPFAI